MLDGLAEDLSHRSEQAQPFVLRQGLDRSLRVDACLPERLVGDDVADAGDESLIHQRRLGSPAPSAKPLQELPLRESQGVGAEASQDGVRLGRGWGEPRPSQLAHVAIAELTVVEHQDEPIPAVAIRLVSRPHQIAGHPEVEQQRGTVGRACQPLAVPVRLIEAATLRTEGFEGDVIVVGAEQHPPYERPPLSKEYLRGEATADSTLLRPAAWYSDNGVDMRLGSRAVSVDVGRRIVRLEDRDGVP